MKACLRCGNLHTDVEEAFGKRLSCTEVKGFWVEAKKHHHRKYGHYAMITTDDEGNYICQKCNRRIPLEENCE